MDGKLEVPAACIHRVRLAPNALLSASFRSRQLA